MLPSSTLEGCSYPARGRSTASTGLCRLLWWDGEGGGASDTFEALEDALHRLNATGHQWEQWSVQVQYWAREGNEGDLPDLYEVRMSDCAGKVFVVTSTGPSYALEADESFADCLDRLQHHNKVQLPSSKDFRLSGGGGFGKEKEAGLSAEARPYCNGEGGQDPCWRFRVAPWEANGICARDARPGD